MKPRTVIVAGSFAQVESEYLMLLEKKRADPFLMLDPDFRRRLSRAADRWLAEKERKAAG